MAWSLVCPANRGIGFYLTRHLLQTTNLPIVATTRQDTSGVKKNILKDLEDVDPKRLTVLELDVTDEDSISRAAQRAEDLFPPSSHHLHLAFSIPGILYPEKSPSQLQHSQLTETFAVNTIGPLLLTKHFTPFLPKKSAKLSLPPAPPSPAGSSSSASASSSSPPSSSTPSSSTPALTPLTLPPHSVWLNMAARVGSVSDNSLGGWYSYRASKAGIFSITKTLDLYLRTRSGDRAMAIAYHPGTVRTELSREFWGSVKEGKLFTPEFAVGKMVDVAVNVGLQGRGRCWDWKGEEIKP